MTQGMGAKYDTTSIVADYLSLNEFGRDGRTPLLSVRVDGWTGWDGMGW